MRNLYSHAIAVDAGRSVSVEETSNGSFRITGTSFNFYKETYYSGSLYLSENALEALTEILDQWKIMKLRLEEE